MFGQHLSTNYAVIVAMLLFVIGFANLLLQQNMIKKIIGLNIMDTSVYLFLALRGYIANRLPPITVDGIEGAEYYINPVPSGLVLTGIVVGVSVTGLMLALTICMYEKYHTLDLDEISTMIKMEEK
ncbi:MAG: cation:proton antiporter subunit C [Eubacteriales bacterium]